MVRDWKNLPLAEPQRFYDFQDTFRSQKKKNEKSNLLSPLPQGAPNPLKRQNAVSTDSIRHQSLSFTLNFAYSAPSFLFSFSLPFSYFYACRHIQRVHDFIVFFNNFPLFFVGFFPKRQVATQLPAGKHAGCSTGLT